jgi:hypothetical protein
MAKKHPWFRSRCYLHFDPPIGFKRAQSIVTSPKRVARHSFYPLIAYHVESKKLKHDKSSGKLIKKTKQRPIAYAAHLDSQIYSYYAWRLSAFYEKHLQDNRISDTVLAFRPLGKSNVDFAAEAFKEIENRRNCSAVALDISGFFDNLDHEILKTIWAKLLGVSRLPDDHYCIYKSLTKSSKVNKEQLYQTLNISENNPRKDKKIRLCSSADFREKVRNTGLIETNESCKGIPQGTPISALLSNIYMAKFDIDANDLVKAVGGVYLRYCDDMLFIVPTSKKNDVAGTVRKLIKNLRLDINVEKTEIHDFRDIGGMIQADKPLQYLGFTYDGKNILIRSASLARYSERMRRGVGLAKATMRKRNKLKKKRGESPKDLFKRKIYKRYSHLGRRNFIRYGLRSSEIMNSKAIRKQLKPLWDRLLKEIGT